MLPSLARSDTTHITNDLFELNDEVQHRVHLLRVPMMYKRVREAKGKGIATGALKSLSRVAVAGNSVDFKHVDSVFRDL